MIDEKTLQQAGNALDRAIKQRLSETRYRQGSTDGAESLIKELVSTLKQQKVTDIDFSPIIEAISNLKVNNEVNVPQVEVKIPEIRVPTPTVNLPDKMPIEGWVSLMGVNAENPLPVQLRTHDGKIFEFAPQSAGGGAHTVKIGGILDSAWSSVINPDGRLKVETNDGASTSSTEVKQVSGTADSVVVNDILAVSTTLPVNQVSGAGWSVSATQVTSPWVVSATDLDIRDLTNTSDSIRAYQLSGASWSVEATQSGTWNIGTVSTLTGITNSLEVKQVSGFADSVRVNAFDTSVAASLVDSSGVQYSGSNPLPTFLVAGSGNSTISVGPVLHDAADDGAAPQKVGGTAMTANPTAVSGGDIVRFVGDDIGRQVTRPIQVRDLISTAYVTLSDSSEDTLFAGAASTLHDLIYVMAANASNAAVNIDIRCGTGGSKATTLSVPANATIGFVLPVPYPASEVAQTWTAQNSGSDISGTTVNITALFSKEV